MSKTLVAVGCAGFIGLNFLLEYSTNTCREIYDNVIVIDKLGYATEYNLNTFRTCCSLSCISYVITQPVSDITSIRIEDTCDVINFASESHVDNSILNPSTVFIENCGIVPYIVDMIGIDNIDTFFHASTDEVYGDLPLEYSSDSSKWFNRDSKLSPNNPYSASKLSQDCYLDSLHNTFGLNLVKFRMANQYGYHQYPEKMMPASIRRAMRGEPIRIYGDGSNIRQWTYVKDTSKALCKMLIDYESQDDNIKPIKDLIHLAYKGERLYSNKEVVDIWSEILIKNHNIETKIEYIEDRKGHDTMYALTDTTYDECFTTSLDEGFTETIQRIIRGY